MKLYYFPIAPNPTKVRVYLAEKGIALETVRVNLGAGEQRSPEFLARNPQGRLPVLELDDGRHVTESLPIIEYLEELFPDPPMIGTTAVERALVRSLERIADVGVLIPAARAVHATRSPLGLPPNPAVAENALAAAHAGLARLDAELAKHAFVAGEGVTIADCTLWAGLGFASFRGFELEAEHANVKRWRKDFAQRPSTQLPF